MDFIDLVKSRRSVRRFTDQEVPDEMITKLLEAAQAAPSGGNCQPWHFYVVKSRPVISDICKKSGGQTFIEAASVVIVVCAVFGRTEPRYGERGRNLYSIQDTAAAIQNILLCAKSLGLGTCWCGAFDEAGVTDILRLDKDVRPIAVIPVGYPADEPAMPKRRPLSEIVTYI